MRIYKDRTPHTSSKPQPSCPQALTVVHVVVSVQDGQPAAVALAQVQGGHVGDGDEGQDHACTCTCARDRWGRDPSRVDSSEVIHTGLVVSLQHTLGAGVLP